jgi:Fungal potassium channel
MLSTNSWTNQIFQNCTSVKGCVAIPFAVGKWLFVACIIFSFLLVRNIPDIVNLLILTFFLVKLGYEGRKTKRIIASRDISYAFTNIMANNYYSLRKNSCLVIKCTY